MREAGLGSCMKHFARNGRRVLRDQSVLSGVSAAVKAFHLLGNARLSTNKVNVVLSH